MGNMDKEHSTALTILVVVFMSVCVAYIHHIKQSFAFENEGYTQAGVMKMLDNNAGEIYIPIFRKNK